jgi:hypothetical protein
MSADELGRAMAVAVADVLISLAQNKSKNGAWASHAAFTSGLQGSLQ